MSFINQPHITILCSRLDLPGGIERAVINTANLFSNNGCKVTVVILDFTDKTFYPVHSSVNLIQQDLSFGITPDGNIVTRKIKLLSDVLKLRQLLKKINPALVIATEYPFAAAAILAGAKKKSVVVSWEHHHFYELKRNAFWNKIFNLTYSRLDAVICLNEDEKNLFASTNSNPVVIPNFIGSSEKSAHLKKTILTVARLTDVKGIDYLLKIAKKILATHTDWQWKIIGDGDLKKDVLAFIEKEKLQNKLIIQLPVDHNIESEYLEASIYVMTSRHECFPMTLLEAQSAGLPCVAFDCDSGPRHIVTKESGFLIEKDNISGMIETISLLINNPEQRNEMGKNAIESVQRFSASSIFTLWEQKIFSLL